MSVLYCFVLRFLWVFALVLTLTEECPLGRSCGFFERDVEDFFCVNFVFFDEFLFGDRTNPGVEVTAAANAVCLTPKPVKFAAWCVPLKVVAFCFVRPPGEKESLTGEKLVWVVLLIPPGFPM